MTESPDSSSSSSAAVRRRPEPVPPLSSPGAGTRKWNAESRWRAFLRPSDYRTPDSFDEASERFSLNLPYYLTQYAAIGALTVLAGALLSGGVAFVLAVVVALLLVIIAISLTSRIELANSTRFLVFLLVTTRSSSPHPTPPLFSSVSGFHTLRCTLAPHSGLGGLLVHRGHAPRLPVLHHLVFQFAAASLPRQQCVCSLHHGCAPSSLYPAQCVQDAL